MALLETEQMEPEALAQAAFGRLAAIATMGEPTLEPSELVRLISLLADAVLWLGCRHSRVEQRPRAVRTRHHAGVPVNRHFAFGRVAVWFGLAVIGWAALAAVVIAAR